LQESGLEAIQVPGGPLDPLHERARRLLQEQLVFDLHGHPPGTLPLLPRLLGRVPRDVGPSGLRGSGVDGFVIAALGDPNTFRKTHPVDPFQDLLAQLARIRRRIRRAGGSIALDATQILEAAAANRPVFVLGIEGGDFLGRELERLDRVYAEGVRVLQLVHFAHNAIGTIALPWGGAMVEPPARGLSPFGREVVRRCSELGLLVDLAHADEATNRGVLEHTQAPVMCSHTGPRQLQDFPRYLADETIRDIAAGGGLVGLWPFCFRGAGIPDLAALARYAEYLITVAGQEHVGFGTDINGVPGNAAGYRGLHDYLRIAAALLEAGIPEAVAGRLLGGNALGLFRRLRP
jgi:microsomal dipeptidase-like Zn-dependent dipeptidase